MKYFFILIFTLNLFSCVEPHKNKSVPVKQNLHFHVKKLHVTAFYNKSAKKIKVVFLNALHPVFNPLIRKLTLKLALMSPPYGFTKETWKSEKRILSFKIKSSVKNGWESIEAEWDSKYAKRGLYAFLKIISARKLSFTAWTELKNQTELELAKSEQKPENMIKTRLKFMLFGKNAVSDGNLAQLKALDFFAVQSYSEQLLSGVEHALFLTGNIISADLKSILEKSSLPAIKNNAIPFWFPPSVQNKKGEYVRLTLVLASQGVLMCGATVKPEEYEFWYYALKRYSETFSLNPDESLKPEVAEGALPAVIFKWRFNLHDVSGRVKMLRSHFEKNLFETAGFQANYMKFSDFLNKQINSNENLFLNRIVFNFKYGLFTHSLSSLKPYVSGKFVFEEWKTLLHRMKCVVALPEGYGDIKLF